ncbi:MAG: hypothetical protein GY809_00480 [Planctomycetes bacterium]|nr:hypothetical protein [Planctomycetota bacterium]
MNLIEILSQPLWQRIGMTLGHFIWQGSVVALGVGVTIRVLGLRHGTSRYGAYLLAFLMMTACPIITFSVLDIGPEIQAQATAGHSTPIGEAPANVPLTIRQNHPIESILPPAPANAGTLSTRSDKVTWHAKVDTLSTGVLPWALCVWIVGVLLLSARLLLGYVGVCRWRRDLKPLPNPMSLSVQRLATQLGLAGSDRVFISPHAMGVVAVGFLRPMVLIPASLVTQMPCDMLQAVIAHELAHIRRFDLWVNLVQRLTETLLFFHPAVWWLSHHLRTEREHCCDELAVTVTGKRVTYATALEVAGRSKLAVPAALTVGLGHNPRSILNRVRHVLGLTPVPSRSRFWVAGLLGLVLLIPLILLSLFAGGLLKTEKSEVSISAQDLIEKIIASERRIEDIQLHMSCTLPLPLQAGTNFREIDWGSDQGKEFFKTTWTRRDKDGQPLAEKQQTWTTFDGDTLRTLEITPGWSFSKGLISPSDGTVFRGIMSFNILLGRDNWLPLSFGEGLALAKSVTVRDRVEQVDGHPCYVLEAIPSGHSPQIRAWVDFQRDHRVLRLEHYTEQGGKPFEHLRVRLDHIKLKRIEGIWLPVQGSRSYPWNPHAGIQTVVVDVESIKLNQGIPADMFSIDFPKSCIVEDERTQKKYTVGDISEQEAALSDADWQARMRQLSAEELIATLSQAKPVSKWQTWKNTGGVGDSSYATSGYGWENVKWFAPMCRLIKMGLPAVEPVGVALKRSNDPWVQSRLAFVLRAINEPQAVPALIDGLERCAYGTDSGAVETDGTELAEFLKQYQMYLSEAELRMGRPVREITLALERLTCHTEGHEHFFFHDAKGKRLDYAARGRTPETMDRQRELRRTVAKNWRQWWQQNQDTVGSQIWSADMLPMPIKASANGGGMGGMMYASSREAIFTPRLSLAIVPNVGDSGRSPHLSHQVYQRYVDNLAKHGPDPRFSWASSFHWVPTQEDVQTIENLPLHVFGERTYVLLCAREAYVLQSVVENELKWKLKDVQVVKDNAGAPAIRVQFDEAGSKLLRQLSQANISNHLAICAGDEVQYISVIKSPAENGLLLSSDFTETQANDLAEALRSGRTSDPRMMMYGTAMF